MIQRIQSIYLLLSGLGLSSLFFLPFAKSDKPIEGYLSDSIYNIQDHPILIFMTIIGILVTIGAIFLFNNRKLQSKMSIFSIILALFVPLTAALLMLGEGKGINENLNSLHDQLGLYTPLIALIFSFLAYKGIQKDEKLVRSADRLR